jgi:hypothetical protein
MLEVISKPLALRHAEEQLLNAFRAGSTWSGITNIGFPGGSVETEAHWHSDARIWGSFNQRPVDEPASTHFWNAFGILDPTNSKSSLSITVEINPPHAGMGHSVAGAFARDRESGSTFVLHRGRINGIPKDVFWRVWHPEMSVEALDGDRVSQFALVAELESPNVIGQLSSFVHEIVRIKARDWLRAPPPPKPGVNFNPEFIGNKEFQVIPTVTQLVNHGIVVRSLYDELTKRGLDVGNTPAMDLYLSVGSQLRTLFEVKTSTATAAVYAAIGQLMLNGRVRYPDSRLVLVVPRDERSLGLKADLASLGVHVLFYTLDTQVATFDRLSDVLAQP